MSQERPVRQSWVTRAKVAIRENTQRRKEEKEKWQAEKERIRREEESRAQKISENQRRDDIRKKERGRAERKAGVTSLSDIFTPKKTGKGQPKTRRQRQVKNIKKNYPKAPPLPSENFFVGSGADNIIFAGGSSSPKKKKKKGDAFDDFKAFDDL